MTNSPSSHSDHKRVWVLAGDWPGRPLPGRNRTGPGRTGSGPRRARRRLELESLEDRVALAGFYWQLASNSPTVDPNDYQANQTSSSTQTDSSGGTSTLTSNLTVSHSPDQLGYSLVSGFDPGPGEGGNSQQDYTDMASMGWSGAPPQVIMPGQSFTIGTTVSATFSNGLNTEISVGTTANALPPAGATGFAPIDLYTSGNRGALLTGEGETTTQSATASVTFTAPTSETASYQPPIGHPFVLENAVLELVEDAHFSTAQGGNGKVLIYDYQLVAPPPPVAITTAPDITAENEASDTAAGLGAPYDEISVTVSDSQGHSTAPVTTMSDGDGAWSVAGINASSLAAGTVTYTVTQTDAAGTATATQNADNNVGTPTPTPTTPTPTTPTPTTPTPTPTTPTPTTPTPTPTTPTSPTPTPAPPHVMGSVGVSQSRHETSYTLSFDTPLNSASAGNPALYEVLQGVTKVVKKHKQTLYTKPLKIKSVVYNTGPNTVTIMLAKPSKAMVEVAIEPGLKAADGASTTGTMTRIVP